jgi:hypothetical protein
LDKLRSDPFLRDAWIILIYEKNTGFEAAHGWKIVEEYQPSYAVYQKVAEIDKAMDTIDQDPGINTGITLKNEYARILTDALRKRKIYFYVDCVCANPWKRPYESRLESSKTELYRQLTNCRKQLPSMDPSRSHLGATAPKVTWSGKIGHDGKVIHGQNDDLVIALAQCLYWIYRIMQMNYPTIPYHEIFPNIQERNVIRTYH